MNGVKINARSVRRFLDEHQNLKPEVAEEIRHRLDDVEDPITKMFPEEKLGLVMGDPGLVQAFNDGWGEKHDSIPPWALRRGDVVTAQHGYVD